mgnify:CR=1 FL=1
MVTNIGTPRWKLNAAYPFIFPSFFLLFLFVLLPLVLEFYLGLSEPTSSGFMFTGAKNIIYLVKDEIYNLTVRNTLFFLLINTSVKFAAALLAALALNRPFRGRKLVRALLVVPWALPEISAYLAWRWLYDANHGVLNYFLLTLGLIKQPVAFLAESGIAIYFVIWAQAWKYIPFYTLILLAALQSIPSVLYEAATIDGANKLQIFRHITFPSIRTIFITTMTLSFVWTFGEFNSVWILTRGGPATSVLGTYAYVQTFILQRINLGIAGFLIVLPLVLASVMLLIRLKIFR